MDTDKVLQIFDTLLKNHFNKINAYLLYRMPKTAYSLSIIDISVNF